MPYGYQPPPPAPGVPQGYHYQTPGVPQGYQPPPPGVPQGYHYQIPSPSFPPPTSAFASAPPPPPANTRSTRSRPSASKNKQTGSDQSAANVPLSVLKEIQQHPKYDFKFSLIQNLKFFANKERQEEPKVRKQKRVEKGVEKVLSANKLKKQAWVEKQKEKKKEQKAAKKAAAEVKVKVEEEEEDEVKEEDMEEEDFDDEEVKEEEDDDEEEGKLVIKQEP
ncbi:MAG: hypothetical protein Q9180_009186 [Flavoplaca navasiana]